MTAKMGIAGGVSSFTLCEDCLLRAGELAAREVLVTPTATFQNLERIEADAFGHGPYPDQFANVTVGASNYFRDHTPTEWALAYLWARDCCDTADAADRELFAVIALALHTVALTVQELSTEAPLED